MGNSDLPSPVTEARRIPVAHNGDDFFVTYVSGHMTVADADGDTILVLPTTEKAIPVHMLRLIIMARSRGYAAGNIDGVFAAQQNFRRAVGL